MRGEARRCAASRGRILPRRRVRSSRDRDSITRDRRNGVTYRIVTDNQGSVRLVVNAETGDVAQRLDYDSFGRVLRDTNPGFQPFGFQGGLYDPDTGLVEFGCRWYDAETGRWISKDPILLEGGWNVYAFCDNDPVNRMDPSGLYSFWQWTSQVIGAVTGVAQTIGGVSLAITGGISGVGAVAGAVVAANGAAAAVASIRNMITMWNSDNDKLWGNSGAIGLATSLLTDDPTFNAIAGVTDTVVSFGASKIAYEAAVIAVTPKYELGTNLRMMQDYNSYGTLREVNRLKSPEQLASEYLRPTIWQRRLSIIGVAGAGVDSALNFKAGSAPVK